MAVFQSEDRARLKRVKSEQAINLAMQSKWEEAAEVNRQILELFPSDVDAHNRLGKALMELGRYAEARDAYSQALKHDPMNTIAERNLQRLAKLTAEAAAPAPSRVDPRVFIEESGRTAITTLVTLAPAEVVAKLTAGDELNLEVAGSAVRVRDANGELIGRLEPKLGQRVLKLIELGNRYSAAVTSVDDRTVRVIIREVYRDPKMGNRPSFPTVGPEPFRGYIKDTMLRYEEEEEELVEEAPEELEPVAEAEIGVEEPPTIEEPDLAEES